MTQQDTYQQHQPQSQMHQPPPQFQYQEHKQGIQDFFVGKDKLGLFLLLGMAIIFIGILVWDLAWSGLVDDGLDAINFLGLLLVDMGILMIISLILLAGIYREDLPDKTRHSMIIIAGIIFAVFMIASFMSGSITSGVQNIDWSDLY